ncbi:MAG: peptidase M23 [Sphingomonas sp. 28-63-12]|nr:MAG: peptidase M23 [Sphingomonas sp. 28-63-12]
MPVVGVARTEIADSWGDPRDNGQRAHHGTDIIAPAGMPVVAAAAGVVEKLSVSAAGGTTIYIRSPDRRWSYYYAHLANYAPGLHEGQLVETGEMIGFVGDTGNAGLGNYHLHFGLSQMRTADGWWQGTPIDPYPSLAGKTGPG